EHYVYFQYVPKLFIIGGYVTIIAALFCIAYLLRLDRFIPARWKARWRGLWASFNQRLSQWQSETDEPQTEAPSET
ncbi:MAG: hypothetical protein H7175_07045, partial [Burkholderiales bacterium]|nr:hypothetical protein [Anaerolineae bacterium]